MFLRDLALIAVGLPLLAACELPEGVDLGQPRTIAEQCVARAASSLKVKRADILVTEALSVPEGDIVTMQVPGTGTVRCDADVDGNITQLVNLSAPPAAAAPPA